MALRHARPRRWTLDEYHALAESGQFRRDERLELIDGEIVSMPAQSTAHWRTVTKATKRLVYAYGDTHEISVQSPYAIPDWSEPEPDLVLLSSAAFQSTKNPRADLVIEVSVSSLEYDCSDKASLYAAAGVPEYWILNVSERQLECHVEPFKSPAQPFGAAYRTRILYSESSDVAAQFRLDVRIPVSDLLD